jgi:hypothetical protein
MTEHPNLAAALVAALADVSVVEAGRTAKIDGREGKRGYEYKYADLGDVVKLTRPALAAHGIVALTPVEEHDRGLKCTVVLLHTSGDKLEFGPFPFPNGNTAQATGSMVTYYRRYALIAALGIAAGDDDDGASAESAAPTTSRAAAPLSPSAPVDGHIADMKPRDVADALRARDLPLGGTIEEMRARLAEAVGQNEQIVDGPASAADPKTAGSEPAASTQHSDPATISMEVADRLMARVMALPDDLRDACTNVLTADFNARFPYALTADEVPEASSHITEFEQAADTSAEGQALVERARARAGTK